MLLLSYVLLLYVHDYGHSCDGKQRNFAATAKWESWFDLDCVATAEKVDSERVVRGAVARASVDKAGWPGVFRTQRKSRSLVGVLLVSAEVLSGYREKIRGKSGGDLPIDKRKLPVTELNLSSVTGSERGNRL